MGIYMLHTCFWPCPALKSAREPSRSYSKLFGVCPVQPPLSRSWHSLQADSLTVDFGAFKLEQWSLRSQAGALLLAFKPKQTTMFCIGLKYGSQTCHVSFQSITATRLRKEAAAESPAPHPFQTSTYTGQR